MYNINEFFEWKQADEDERKPTMFKSLFKKRFSFKTSQKLSELLYLK